MAIFLQEYFSGHLADAAYTRFFLDQPILPFTPQDTMNQLLMILSFICWFSNVTAQSLVFFEDNATQPQIVCQLFEGAWDPRTSECVWKPNLSEKFLFGVSDDGMLYTTIHKTLDYQGSDARYTILILSTYAKYAGEYLSCHVCAPGLSILTLRHDTSLKRYHLKSFNKFAGMYGAWGVPPADVSLFHIGGDDYCVKIDEPYDAQGITDVHTTLFYEGKTVLRYASEGDNQNTGLPASRLYQYTTTILADKAHKTVTLHKRGTIPVDMDKESPILHINEQTTYRFVYGLFERQCR